MATSDFLRNIPGKTTLNRITIPGSHDAGVYEDAAEGTGKGWAVCQTGNLRDQCDAGSRFFDIRLNAEGKATHKTAGIGAVGGEIGTMMRDVGGFLVNNPSEFVILRFSKCKGKENIVETLTSRFSHILYKGDGNLASTSLDTVRGKVVAAFSTKDGEFTKFLNPKSGIHAFGKYTGNASGQSGLVTCGAHAGVVSVKKVYEKQLKMVHQHDEHTDDEHLSVLYWTQTAAGVFESNRNIKEFTTGDKGTHAKTTDLMNTLKTEVEDFKARGGGVFGCNVVDEKLKRMKMAVAHPKLPNVIMYDFVNVATSTEIIGLNDPAVRLY